MYLSDEMEAEEENIKEEEDEEEDCLLARLFWWWNIFTGDQNSNKNKNNQLYSLSSYPLAAVCYCSKVIRKRKEERMTAMFLSPISLDLVIPSTFSYSKLLVRPKIFLLIEKVRWINDGLQRKLIFLPGEEVNILRRLLQSDDFQQKLRYAFTIPIPRTTRTV